MKKGKKEERERERSERGNNWRVREERRMRS